MGARYEDAILYFMTKEDIVIADSLIKIIGDSHFISKSSLLEKAGKQCGKIDDVQFDSRCYLIIRELKGFGIIFEENNHLSLTKDGIISLRKGLKKYLSRYEKEKDMDLKLKSISIWSNKIRILLGISNLITFMLGVLLSAPIKELLHYLLSLL